MKIVYVDEQSEARDAWRRHVFVSDEFTLEETEVLDPEPDLDQMIAMIEDLDPDALVTDQRLSEFKVGVAYDGTELVARFLSRRRHFPCFVTTNFAAEAADRAPLDLDVNMIFSKEQLSDDEGDELAEQELTFFGRVKRKVHAYQRLLQSREEELMRLIGEAEGGPMPPQIANRVMELDHELEAMVGGRAKLPVDIKERASAPLAQLLERAEAILAELEQTMGPEQGRD